MFLHRMLLPTITPAIFPLFLQFVMSFISFTPPLAIVSTPDAKELIQ